MEWRNQQLQLNITKRMQQGVPYLLCIPVELGTGYMHEF